MAKVSKRGESIPVSAMRKLTPLAVKAVQDGKKVVKLNIGQPDILTPPEFWEAAAKFPEREKTLAYAPSRGRPELLTALEQYYNSHNITVSESDIVVSVGGCEAILISLMAICDVGDEILVVEPFYSNYSGCAAMSGITFEVITTSSETAYHLPSREEIESKITDKTRGIMYASPGNPTGTVLTRDEVQLLVDVANAHGLFVIGDEVYREFIYDESQPTSVLHIDNTDQCGIIVDSVSKRYSACGARIGCIVSKNKDFIAACTRLATVRLSAPALDQVAIAACIQSPNIASYTERVIAEYKLRRDTVVDAIEKMDGITCNVPSGAFYLVAKADGVDTEELCRFLLTEFEHNGETVMVSPLGGFYKTEGYGCNEVRIAYVLEEEKLKHAMDLFYLGVTALRQKSAQ